MADARIRVPFGLWGMRIPVPYSLLVRERGLAWSCGQCPLDPAGEVLSPGDLVEQSRHVARFIPQILREAGLAPRDIAKLVIFYVPQGEAADRDMLSVLAGSVEGSAILVPVAAPEFYYPGMLIEVDVHVERDHGPARTYPDEHGVRVEVVAGPELTFAGVTIPRAIALSDAAAAASRALEAAGLFPGSLLAGQWFGSAGNDVRLPGESPEFRRERVIAALDGGARVLGELVHVSSLPGDPTGAAVTTETDESEGSRTTIGRYKDLFWVHATDASHPGDGPAQTTAIMRSISRTLDRRGLDFTSVCKSTTFYVAPPTPEGLHENMEIRNAYYRSPGPASTGIRVAGFGEPGAMVSVSLLGRTKTGGATAGE